MNYNPDYQLVNCRTQVNKKSLIIDGRLSWAGGQYYTPVDLESSKLRNDEVLFDDQAFTLKNDDYFRMDLRVGMKINGKKRFSHYFYFDLQNVLNNNNIFAQRYNRVTNEVNRVDQLGIFPDFLYRLQF